MSALAALARAYDRMAARNEVPSFGYSIQNIGFLISLNEDGSVVGRPANLRSGDGRKPIALPLAVPQPVKRTAGVAPNFLWDKTAYVLGVTGGEGKRTADEHGAFIARHVKALTGHDDPGLKALLEFLAWWTPEKFDAPGWPSEMKDENVVFSLESDRLHNLHLHDRPAAKTLWAS